VALEITVDLYDYSSTHPDSIREAERAAAATLRKADVDVRWRYCAMAVPGEADWPACGAGAGDVNHLVVNVLPERMSCKIAKGPYQFGTALMSHEGGFPTQAYVFFDRVVDFAAERRLPWPSILGMMIAHEAGHLLLGNNSHFPDGIMRARWRTGEFKLALMGALTFTSQQAQQIRYDVQRRITCDSERKRGHEQGK
jgi:hypothetical protein